MKIKEFIKEFGYSMNYDESLNITIGSYDVTFKYDNQDNVINVHLHDFDGKNYLISVIREENSLIPDYYHEWCENELKNGNVNIKFCDFDIIDKLMENKLEFSVILNEFNERYLALVLSNEEYSAPLTNTDYWKLVWTLIKFQTGIID